MKKFFSLLLASLLFATVIQASTSIQREEASTTIPDGFTEIDYTLPEWNEIDDIHFYGSGDDVRYSSPNLYFNGYSNTLLIETNISVNSVLFYEIQSSHVDEAIDIYLNGNLVETKKIVDDDYMRYYLSLNIGTNQIKFVAPQNSWGINLRYIGILKTPLISVNLTEPGSLGTEILFNNVERLQDVHNLKVAGQLNDDDISKLDMMKDNLVFLDLTDATLTTIPRFLFWRAEFLKSIILPEGVKTIGDRAFSQSTLEEILLPSSLETIGAGAFSQSLLSNIAIPNNLTQLGESAFAHCYNLNTISISDYLEVIPPLCFYDCPNLKNFVWPSHLKRIEREAFRGCYFINSTLPTGLESLGFAAFASTNKKEPINETLIIPEGCSVSEEAFSDTNYKYAELPTNFHTAKKMLPVPIQTIKLKCATVVSASVQSSTIMDLENEHRSSVTVVVPSYLVNSYKLNPYWFRFKEILGFDTNEIDFWNVNADLVLSAHDRMLGTPSIYINDTGSIKINGTDPMPINGLTIKAHKAQYEYYSKYARIFSNADGVTVNGDLNIEYYFDTAKIWYYMSLPFDVKVSDIAHLDGGLLAIRTYDGANRATNGGTGNWIPYDDNAIIPAGQGFIINLSQVGSVRFPSVNNESKQYMTSNLMFATPLEANVSSIPSNQGWNLIGNPYQCYYNIHKLNFTAPITVRNVQTNKYEAYSIIDDDYAIKPNEAFFVQCPEGVAAITFPLDGRQMTSEITSQQGMPAHNPQAKERKITDLTISGNEDTDQTRIVFNESALFDYELTCDAGKFFSEDTDALQLYSIGNENEFYAINERPALDGTVQLGYIAGKAGKYTISVSRNDSEHVYILDKATGIEREITNGEYEFETEVGTYNSRLSVRIENSISLIEKIGNESLEVKADAGCISINGKGLVEVYNLAGIRVASTYIDGDVRLNVAPGAYIVKTNNQVVKVIVSK